MPEQVDFAVVGGGFTGLAAAAWLRRLDPNKAVALFESARVGAGSSGYTGGLALPESSAGDLPGLGDVLAGYAETLQQLEVDADLQLPGAWELGRTGTLPDSPISWTDSGNLRAVRLSPGGTINPGKVVGGLAHAAQNAGALVFENAPVTNIAFESPMRLEVCGQVVRAQRVLLATNAMSLELSGLARRAQPMFTLVVATEPLSPAKLEALGLSSGRPFYTIDFPYLWGRLLPNDGVLFGGGLVRLNDWRELADQDIISGQAAELIARLESRVHGLHPALAGVAITHRWGGPMLVGEEWQPVFMRHPQSPRAIVIGAFSGHGVALSVYLGRWAAEAMLDRRDLPKWDVG